ncbi:30S ribosomal protein S16 [Chloroflexota bacterium]
MVKIGLRLVGSKINLSSQLVGTDVQVPRGGASIDIIDHYNPLTNPETVVLNIDKTLDRLRQGAQPTDTAARLLSKAGIIEKSKTTKEKT